MAHNIVMPALEMAQETGKLLAWRKKEGEAVKKGEPLLDIETDKAVVEIESPADGILSGISARENDVVPVGQTIAWLLAAGEAVPAAQEGAVSGRHMAPAAPASAPVAAKTPSGAAPSNARISPKARRLAREHGIALETIRGSGTDGEISADDVMAMVTSGSSKTDTAPEPAAGKASMSTIARLMAERTTQSWTSVPHFFVSADADAGALNDARQHLGAQIETSKGGRVTHTDLLVALAARVLAKHPQINASWVEGGIRLNADINVAIAMAVDDGVVAAVIPGADKKELGEIAKLRSELTERARSGKLRPADISGATFTISNLGMYKVDSFSAIINPPQAAILAVGRIADRAVAVNGAPAVRPMMTLTLSSDHRVVDGARAALFLGDLVATLENPATWLA